MADALQGEGIREDWLQEFAYEKELWRIQLIQLQEFERLAKECRISGCKPTID